MEKMRRYSYKYLFVAVFFIPFAVIFMGTPFGINNGWSGLAQAILIMPALFISLLILALLVPSHKNSKNVRTLNKVDSILLLSIYSSFLLYGIFFSGGGESVAQVFLDMSFNSLSNAISVVFFYTGVILVIVSLLRFIYERFHKLRV